MFQSAVRNISTDSPCSVRDSESKERARGERDSTSREKGMDKSRDSHSRYPLVDSIQEEGLRN